MTNPYDALDARAFWSPAVGRRNPATRYSRVDLPKPDGPRMTHASPAATDQLKWEKMGRPPG